MFVRVALALTCVALSYAQVPGLGKCPAVQVVPNLDASKYLGDWYEIKKFFFFIEGSETCIKANYSLKSDGHIKVLNTGVNIDGSKAEAIGDALMEDPKVPAKLSVSFNGSPRVPYWIVDTDYDTYSLVWSCVDLFGFVQTDFAWILSRNNTLEATDVKMLEDKLASYGVDVSSFSDTVQDNCTY